MSKLFRLFVACCAMSLAALFTTATVNASSGGGFSSGDSSQTTAKAGCVGKGACGITKHGTILIGKWREV